MCDACGCRFSSGVNHGQALILGGDETHNYQGELLKDHQRHTTPEGTYNAKVGA